MNDPAAIHRSGSGAAAAPSGFEAQLKDVVGAARLVLRRPGVRRAAGIARWALLIGVFAWLLYSLARIGWAEVVAALPDNPLFYLIFALRYLLQPLSEIPVYAISWRRPMRVHWRAFLRKRVYNAAVFGYSGEAWFTLWARSAFGLSDKEVLVAVKDNNLVSAFVSNAFTALAIAALMMDAEIRDAIAAAPGAAAIFAIAFAPAAGLSVAFIILRARFVGFDRADFGRVLAINVIRIAVVAALHALLYDSAIPGPPLSAWFIFIALQLALTRLPFLPNQDVLFLTLAIGLSGLVGAPQAAVAAMLLAETFLSLASHLAVFVLTAGARTREDEMGLRRDGAPARLLKG